MSKKKNGLNPKQRKKALQALGLERARDAKGSHEIWQNPEIVQLARTHEIEAPANLTSGVGQNPGVITVPDNPASGTWNGIVKLATWYQNKAKELKDASPHDRKRVEFSQAFNAAAKPTRRERKQERKLQAAAETRRRNSAVHSPSPV